MTETLFKTTLKFFGQKYVVLSEVLIYVKEFLKVEVLYTETRNREPALKSRARSEMIRTLELKNGGNPRGGITTYKLALISCIANLHFSWKNLENGICKVQKF